MTAMVSPVWLLLLVPGGCVAAESVVQLRLDESVPAAWGGELQRLRDDEVIVARAGESLQGWLPGAYRGSDGRLLLLRPGDSAGDHARALVGLRTLQAEELPLRERLGEALVALDHVGLAITTWRHADDAPWPWVDLEDPIGGLPRLVQRQTGESGAELQADGLVVDRASKEAIRIGEGSGVAIGPGDCLTMLADEESWGVVALLAEDRGRIGRLDAADLVVACQRPSGALLEQVVEGELGRLFAGAAIHAFSRDPSRLAPIDPDNPIWAISRERQLLTLAGLVVITLVLLRRGRRWRRRMQEQEGGSS